MPETSFIFFMVCHTVLQSNEHQTDRSLHFWSSHVSTVKQLLLLYVFFQVILYRNQ